LKQKKNFWITGTPYLWKHFLSHFGRQRFDSVKCFTISGGGLGHEAQAKLFETFPQAELIKTYGQTEAFRSLLCKCAHGEVHDHLGKAVQGVKLSLMDDGELHHSGDGVMVEYVNDREETLKKRIDLADRSLDCPTVSTGDFFKQDCEGNYIFLGRKDRMLKRMGYKIYPETIESFLSELDFVSLAKVHQDKGALNRWG
jgi:acyl-coenzyme A synthetase/AMP-(fatty) acid ligase